MIGNLNLPIAKGNAKTYIFTSTDLSSAPSAFRSMQRWEKPKGINFVYAMLINAGTGGGGGHSFGGGTAGGGGGGGAPGNVIQFIQPAYLVPDVLYMTVARGGTGGAAATAGGYPSLSTGMWYSVVGSTAAATRMYYAFPSTTPAGTTSGRAGAVGAGGNGGIAYTISTTLQQPGVSGFSNLSISAVLTGFAGTLIAGTNATFAGRPQGGAGGGGVTSGVAAAGGNVLGPTTSGQSVWSRDLLGGAATGQAGEDGIVLFEPTLFSLPGAGGGANASGTGGKGGKGGIGCGGGGGGAGTTGGAGGDGGDGLVILVCW
jgi:hypothetical protein